MVPNFLRAAGQAIVNFAKGPETLYGRTEYYREGRIEFVQALAIETEAGSGVYRLYQESTPRMDADERLALAFESASESAASYLKRNVELRELQVGTTYTREKALQQIEVINLCPVEEEFVFKAF